MESDMTFRDKVFGILLNHEGEFIIEKKVKPENRERFVKAVKEIIDREIDIANGIKIQFGYELKKIRKTVLF